jgi:hypothetical protein
MVEKWFRLSAFCVLLVDGKDINSVIGPGFAHETGASHVVHLIDMGDQILFYRL